MTDIALDIRQKIGHWLNGAGRHSVNGSFKGPLRERKRVLIVSNLVCAEDRETLRLIKSGMRELCPNAEIFVCSYYEVKQGAPDDFISDGRTIYFSEKDFSFFFRVKRDDLLSFLAMRYDITIFMSNRNTVFTDFISHYIKSDLRVGWANSEIDNSGIANLAILGGGEGKSSVKNILDTLKMMFEN